MIHVGSCRAKQRDPGADLNGGALTPLPSLRTTKQVNEL